MSSPNNLIINRSKTLIRKLATQGNTFSIETFRSLKATYFRTALDFVEIYKKDCDMNSIEFDIDKEERAVELFAENIMKAGETFLDKPLQTPLLPKRLWCQKQ